MKGSPLAGAAVLRLMMGRSRSVSDSSSFREPESGMSGCEADPELAAVDDAMRAPFAGSASRPRSVSEPGGRCARHKGSRFPSMVAEHPGKGHIMIGAAESRR